LRLGGMENICKPRILKAKVFAEDGPNLFGLSHAAAGGCYDGGVRQHR
jgi:hypothetical protein